MLYNIWIHYYSNVDRIKKHQDWSGKYCPYCILDEKCWDNFKESIQKARNQGILSADVYIDVAINKYDDMQLLSYQAAVINRTYK